MTTLINHIKKSPHRNRLERYLRSVLPLLEGSILDIGKIRMENIGEVTDKYVVAIRTCFKN